MHKLKVYLDTSVVNFFFAEDAPDYMDITIDFFENYLNEYDVFISEILYIEINKTRDEKKRKILLEAIKKYELRIFGELNEGIEYLAGLYIENNVIPENKIEDAYHIAYATYYEFDILLSWNFKHLANIKKQIAINSLNEREGYLKKILLISPLEAVYEK